MILTEKLQKYQHYLQVKLKNMNIFHVKKFEKAFEKHIKTIEVQGKKQVKALVVLKPNTQKLTTKDAIPENTLTEEPKNELNKIKDIEKMVGRENLIYRTN